MSRFVIVCLLLIPKALLAQFSYVLDQTIPVKDINGSVLSNAWGGGLNAAQFNSLDLDSDGKNDLVLFDRMANKVITYINTGSAYQYRPEYETLFPDEVKNWMLLRDFNCDGKKDIFTAHVLGISVFLNTTSTGELLTWQQVLFTSGGEAKSEVILSKGSSGLVNIQLQFDDLPAINDADGDGDLDIFNMRYGGSGTVEYHKNLSKELHGTCDSLVFERLTQTWGNFRKCHCSIFAFNNDDCPEGGRVKHSTGSALLAMDANGDNITDLVYSGASCTELYLLTNEGSTDAPVVSSFSLFPPDQPVNYQIFPAAFYEDVDFDGVKDLVSAPNLFHKEHDNLDLAASNWFYKNTGTDANPGLEFVRNNFMQDQMIDIGDNAVPAFGDFDADGDQDLFVSRNALGDGTSGITLFQNKGTSAAPEFQIADHDYLNLGNSGLFNIKIQLTDIDKNNTKDLVFTATDHDTQRTRLYYYGNKSTTSLDFSAQTPVAVNFTLTFSENLHLTDVNADGLPDILLGRSSGALEYWKNNGVATAPAFVLEEANFLGIGSTIERQNISAASADLDGDGKIDLLLGDQTGELRIVPDYRNKTEVVTNVIYNTVTEDYDAFNLGGNIWPALADLFNSGKPSVVVGNSLGGLQILRGDEGSSTDQPVVEVYPNPVLKDEMIKIKSEGPVEMQIFNLLGEKVIEAPILLQGKVIHQYKIPFLAAGLYLLKFRANGKSITRRLIVL